MAVVTVALLGALELRVDDRIVVITRPRLRALLCALALRAGQSVAVSVLVEDVWGEKLPGRPVAALHTLVNLLRGFVGADVVRTTADGYRLDVSPDAVDVLRFQRLLDSAPDDDPVVARQVLVAALGLWRGSGVSADLPEHVPHDVAERLVERYLSAVERQVDIDLQLGRHAELVGELRMLTARFELRESLWARLILALQGAGRHAEALEAYQDLRELLAGTLGASPSTDLRGLHAQLLASDDDDLPAVGWPAAPRQLPPDIAGFTGRAAEVVVLDKEFDQHGPVRPPLVMVLHGPGGAGKTALGLHWAHRVGDRFLAGQVYLDMRGYGPGEPVDPVRALEVMLRAVGVHAAQIPDSVEERTALWRTTSYGRRMLVFLDNVRDAEQVRPLLPGSGEVVVLVTSRNDLRGLSVTAGARRFDVGELSCADAIAVVESVIGAERCAAEPVALTQLIEVCGRLPLALVIAAEQAARYPDVPIADLVADLRADGGRLDLLADPGDAAADIRKVFSWSYRALTADVARAFRLLGLHPTPELTVDVAAALLGLSPQHASSVLSVLASVHLLEEAQHGSFHFHDLLQVYAVERASAEAPPEEVSAARARILDWYLYTVRRARIAAFGELPLEMPERVADDRVIPAFPDFATAMAWYQRNRGTLLAVMDYADEHGFDRHGWQLALLLRLFHETQRHLPDAMRASKIALRCAERSAIDAAITCATYMRGAAYNMVGQSSTARRWLHDALELSEHGGNLVMIAFIEFALGMAHQRAGQLDAALRQMERAVQVATRSGARAVLARTLLNLGAIQGMLGKLDQALDNTHRAYQLYREMNSVYFTAFARGNMAEAALDVGRLDDALIYADEALALLGQIEDQVSMPETLIVKGRILNQLGRTCAARETWQRALRILASMNNPRAAEVEQLLAGR